MMTHLDLLLRTLASPARLRILAILFREGAAPFKAGPIPRNAALQPTHLAITLGLDVTTISRHLKLMLRLQIVRYWKKDRRKFYSLSSVHDGSARHRLLERLQIEVPSVLPRLPAHLPKVKGSLGRRTRPPLHAGSDKSPLRPLWRVLTSFSNFRRMLMLRLLIRPGGATFEELVRIADIKPPTVRYHLRKLKKRTLLDVQDDRYRILGAKPPSPLQGFMTSLVAAAQIAGAGR